MRYFMATLCALNMYSCIHAMDLSAEVSSIQQNGRIIMQHYCTHIQRQLPLANIPILYKQDPWLQFMNLQENDHLVLFEEKTGTAEAMAQKLFDFKNHLEQYEALCNSIRRAQESHNQESYKRKGVT